MPQLFGFALRFLTVLLRRYQPHPFDSPPQRLVSELNRLFAAGEGKNACRWGRPAAPTCKRTTLSQQMDARTRCDSGVVPKK